MLFGLTPKQWKWLTNAYLVFVGPLPDYDDARPYLWELTMRKWARMDETIWNALERI